MLASALLHFLLHFAIFSAAVSEEKFCFLAESLQKCEVGVPKTPVANFVETQYSGYSSEKCLQKMSDFKWRSGLFCPDSLFCGFGLDFTTEIDNSDTEVKPLNEVCFIFVDQSKETCDSIREKLEDVGIAKSERFHLVSR